MVTEQAAFWGQKRTETRLIRTRRKPEHGKSLTRKVIQRQTGIEENRLIPNRNQPPGEGLSYSITSRENVLHFPRRTARDGSISGDVPSPETPWRNPEIAS